MKDLFETVFGRAPDLAIGQMIARAVAMFFIALLLARLSGRRTFGKGTAFDVIVAIMLGSLLSRAITGASPFAATVAASAAIVCLHRLIGWLTVTNHAIGKITKGEELLLYERGRFHWRNMHRACISENDLKAGVRQELHQDSFENVETIYLENDGKLSIVRKIIHNS